MNLIKFDPWLTERRPFIRKSYGLPSVFDDLFGSSIGNVIGADFATNVPSVNISEAQNGYQLEIAAPGLSKEDFKISLDKDRLTVSAEKSLGNETTEGKFTRREFNYSSFSRSFVLPKTVDKEQIAAKYENGVLMLTAPKKAEVVKEEKSRMIEIG
ncbi:MAG TPA: Hsp20/alpha crystallin family protein [Saprospiraceae bacterium]|nr:Hsp20/alpha crystallin family protein [Saprospiraceae bacterium]